METIAQEFKRLNKILICPNCGHIGMWNSCMKKTNIKGDKKQEYRCPECNRRTVNPNSPEHTQPTSQY